MLLDGIPKLRQQIDELIKAAMDIADDVERAVFVLQVVPQRLTLDFCRVNLFGRMQHMDSAKTFTFKVPQGPAQLLRLLAYDVWTESRGLDGHGFARDKASLADQKQWRPEDSDIAEPEQ